MKEESVPLTMKVDVFIPVRLSSNRLPAKHMKEISGKPVIEHLVARARQAKKIRHVIICTTKLPTDDPLVDFLKNKKILYFRGSDKDILQRFLDAARYFRTDAIIDVEGDKLYTDPVFIDKIVTEMEKSDADWVSGNSSSTEFSSKFGFPHGIVPAGIRTSALEKICKLKKTDNTETGYKEFFTSTNLFKCKYIFPESKISFSEKMRLTLDYQEDLDLAKKIFSELGTNFHFMEVIELFNKKPELLQITESAIEKWKKYYEQNVTDYSLKRDI